MPCEECENGKYKWGKTGECKYDTKEACEKSNPKKYNKMNPTPLGKKTYAEYEKELKEFNLSKVERVELGLVDDMGSVDKTLAKVWDNSNKNIDLISDLDDKVEQLQRKAEGLLKDLKSDSSKMNKERDNGKKLISNFEKATKELGIKPNDSAEYKRLSKRITEAEQQNDTIKDWIRVATQITKI
jgi:hypothetical protein